MLQQSNRAAGAQINKKRARINRKREKIFAKRVVSKVGENLVAAS